VLVPAATVTGGHPPQIPAEQYENNHDSQPTAV